MDLDAFFQEHPMGGVEPPVKEGFRSGFVSLVGRPNAGKSTLLNAVVDKKIAITSPTSQTTRTRIEAVLTRPDFQLILIDTPGLHKPHDVLGENLNAHALAALEDVDVVVFVVDATKQIGSGDRWVARHIEQASAKRVCVINKIDIATREQIDEHLSVVLTLMPWDGVITLSAKSGYKVDEFIDLVAGMLEEGPRWFPEDMESDQSIEMLIAEFIREKILRDFRDEIPHAVGVMVDDLSYVKKKDLYRIFATIYIERESQKAIIIGKGGSSIKRIGTNARKDLERLLGCRVYLDLSVKVKKNWRSDEGQIRRFGYID